MTQTQAPPLEHPVEPLEYSAAIEYVENWLNEHILTPEEHEHGIRAHVYDYADGEIGAFLKDRPFVAVRVSEVSFSNNRGGGSYMQVDMPWGIAVCGQVERCLLALLEGWNDQAHVHNDNDGTSFWVYAETEEEFWRLGDLFDQMKKIA